MEYRYQLVVQFECEDNESNYDTLLRMEEVVIAKIGDVGEVDGHDMGSGECNIFVHTNDPEKAFNGIRTLVDQKLPNMKAGYRDFRKKKYTPIWPAGLKKFEVI